MGYGRYNSKVWESYSEKKIYSKKSFSGDNGLYSAKMMNRALDPKFIKIREARDSEDNPYSTPIIIGNDVTGSMKFMLEYMARTGLKDIVSRIYNEKAITNPQIMCMGIGDVKYDDAPLQVTQFESDIRIAEQLQKIWFEGCGGGNDYESYQLAWYFASRYTILDSMEKRNKKGFLFTYGDENPTEIIYDSELEKIFGDNYKNDIHGGILKCKDLYEEVSKSYHVFHIVTTEGRYCQRHGTEALLKRWQKVMPESHIIIVDDYRKLADVIIEKITEINRRNQ